MKLGMDFPQEWREKSEKDCIPLSDVLYGYAVEDLMKRISQSSFKEYLWLTNEEALGEEAYKKISKERLEFLYVESEKKLYQGNPMAGQAFSRDILNLLYKEIFLNSEKTDINWTGTVGTTENGAYLLLNANCMDMQVPITMKIEVAHLTTEQPKYKELKPLFKQKGSIGFLSYSKESTLSESLFEIMRKMELISDMSSYHMINETLKNQSISGRHILEDLRAMGEKEPKVVSLKRLEQIASYKDYTYMKKKWQQYVRTHQGSGDEWGVVVERVMTFARPLWKALCEDDIFLDDWMPELGRFLG